ncbi:MAG: hypothetical protein ABIL22_08940 [candidate division WOR-3 bacterium]
MAIKDMSEKAKEGIKRLKQATGQKCSKGKGLKDKRVRKGEEG